jgi:transcriptional regulator with XRE-family HTH domain
MNSIASMPNRSRSGPSGPTPPTPTRESLAFRAARRAAGVTQAEIARRLGIEPGTVSQWETGHRPVPIKLATPVADILRLKDPGTICLAYAETMETLPVGNVVPLRAESDLPLRFDLEFVRMQNDITALTYAINALFGTATFHRPAEAQALAVAIRKTTPPKYRDRGLVAELLATLDKAGKA